MKTSTDMSNSRSKPAGRRHVSQPIRDVIAKTISLIRGREPVVMAALLLAVLGTWGFIELADEVIEGSTGRFDRWAVERLRQPDDLTRPIGPQWIGEVGRDLTALGGMAVLTLFILAAAGFLYVHGAITRMIVLLLSTTSGIVVSLLMKNFFDRPRPDVVPHLSEVYTSSFPSGHSMMSAIVYLTLGSLVAPAVKGFWTRVYVLSCAVLLTGLIGISRVYMGVHYPTDVLAGWSAGLVWALLCWLIARQLTPEPSR